MWTVVSFPCVRLRWLQQLIAHGHVPAVCIGDGWYCVRLFKDGHHLETAFPSCVCAVGCTLCYMVMCSKLSLADSVATKQPLQRSQRLNKLRRYDNHTYIHISIRTRTAALTGWMSMWLRTAPAAISSSIMENVIAPPPAMQNTPVIHQKLKNNRKRLVRNNQSSWKYILNNLNIYFKYQLYARTWENSWVSLWFVFLFFVCLCVPAIVQ